MNSGVSISVADRSIATAPWRPTRRAIARRRTGQRGWSATLAMSPAEPRRGEVWWVAFGSSLGGEIRKTVTDRAWHGDLPSAGVPKPGILAGGGRPSTASSARRKARKVSKVILCDPSNVAPLSRSLLSRLSGSHGRPLRLVLGIGSPCEFRRARQLAGQYRELPPLGFRRPRFRSGFGRLDPPGDRGPTVSPRISARRRGRQAKREPPV
jgi:hypothetical protein